jgi:hypothetical protein
VINQVPAEKLAKQKWNKKYYKKKKLINEKTKRCNVKGCRWWAMPNTYKCLKHS